ncbi:MAG: hypothetical protein C4518_07570 [Desulfobacteraceae bacterium]|nr:MAG: hypothetical protein C4518_07570 [Desulfobacteraceae bacterium]
MKTNNLHQAEKKETVAPLRQSLQESLAHMQKHCNDCPKCRTECAFLRKYGTPREIASNYDSFQNQHLTLACECNLCGLCGAVCPKALHPEEMFLEMRREAVDRKMVPLPEHHALLAYERRGVSGRFSYYMLPKNCHTVFFPGCAFPGTRPEQTLRIFDHLQKVDPSLGMVLDCCCKPSHDLGRSDYFQAMMDEMKSFLVEHGIRKIITACPNCHQIFKTYGTPLEVTTVYELLLQCGLPDSVSVEGVSAVSVHDPCVARFESAIQDAVRKLAVLSGFALVSMPHERCKAICCGEGGNVGAVAPEFSEVWTTRRREEAGGRLLLTYCAGCAGNLSRHTPTAHILDAVLDPESAVSGKIRVSKSPWTYLNRLKVKQILKKKNSAGAVTRERLFSADPPIEKKVWGRIIMLVFFAAVIGALHGAGGMRFLDPGFLRQWVASWGVFAPVLYIVVYTLAPVFFMPGLPITIAGGILFGPVWGVVYTIIGATSGACAAFLVARYAARDWIQARLRSPRWKRLDEGVSRHGWKIVAFTRLIPVFPFNLLNYAFGLTSIPLGHYALASFVCMLPACIAFIVFSSSLPDMVRGRISPEFIIGLALIGIVMSVPVLHRIFKHKFKNK